MSAFPQGPVLTGRNEQFTIVWRTFFQDIYNKTGGPAGLIYASSITNVPYGDVTQDNVQGAIDGLEDRKATVVALASLSTSTSSSVVSLSTSITSLSTSASTGISSLSTGLTSLSTSTSTGITSLSSGLSTTNSTVASLSTGTGAGLTSLSTALSSTNSTVAVLSTSASSGVTSLSTALSATNSTAVVLSTATSTSVASLSTATAGKQPLDATLTALAAVNWAANAFPIGSGADTVAQVSFAASTFPARASTGNLVAKTITDFGLSLVDDTDASAARTTLGLGTLATQSGTFSGTSSGTNTGDQTISITGDVTAAGSTGTLTATIQAGVVTYAKIQNVSATSRILGRITAGAGSTEELTAANVKTILVLTSSDVGLGNVTNDAQTKAAVVPNTAPSAGQVLVGNASGTAYAPVALSSDATLASTGAVTIAAGAVTLAKQANLAANSIIGNNTGSPATPLALTAAQVKTLLAIASGDVSGLTVLATTSPGTGVATALGVNVGTAGAFVVNGGALGTPSSGLATNLSGTASALTAGNVTTNANLTGNVTSVGNATTIAAGVVTEAMQTLSDVTTKNVSTTAHGYTPKAPADANQWLNGLTGAWSSASAPPSAGLTTIASGSLPAAATLTISSIPATYASLILVVTGWKQGTNTARLRVRAGTTTVDSTAGDYVGNVISGTTVTNFTTNALASMVDGATQTTAQTGSATVVIHGYQSLGPKRFESRILANTTESQCLGTLLGTTALDVLEVSMSAAGSFNAGTYALYGVSNTPTSPLPVANGGTGDTGTAWTSYTPTVTSAVGTITTLGTVNGQYKVIGKTMFITLNLGITTNGTGSQAVNATMPGGFTSASVIPQVINGREGAVGGKALAGAISASGTSFSITNYDNSYPGSNGCILVLNGVIELA